MATLEIGPWGKLGIVFVIGILAGSYAFTGTINPLKGYEIAKGRMEIEPVCGNNVCEAGESETCPADCPPGAAPGVTTIITGFSGTPTIQYTGVDKYNPGTSITDANVYWWRNGVYQSASNTSNSHNMANGDKVVAYANRSSYYGNVQKWTVVQEAVHDIEFEMIPHATAASMSTWISDPTGTLHTASNTYAMGAGNVKTFTWHRGGQYETSYGNLYTPTAEEEYRTPNEKGKNILCLPANGSMIDDIDIAGLEDASRPDQATLTTGQKAWCYYIDPLDSNTMDADYAVTIDADDTNNPLLNITLTVCP